MVGGTPVLFIFLGFFINENVHIQGMSLVITLKVLINKTTKIL